MKRSSVAVLFITVLYALTGCVDPNPDPKPPAKPVPVEVASSSTQAYNRLVNNATDIQNRSNSLYYFSERFTKEDLLAVLNEKNCTGIRVYHGLDSTGKAVMYIVGVNGNSDLLPKRSTPQKQRQKQAQDTIPGEEKDHYYILKSEVRCPDVCPADGL